MVIFILKSYSFGENCVDPLTGLITTLKPLDRETKGSYKIIIEVSDNGQPPQSATRVLRINVLDIDDHRPRFARDIVRPQHQIPETHHLIHLFRFRIRNLWKWQCWKRNRLEQ